MVKGTLPSGPHGLGGEVGSPSQAGGTTCTKVQHGLRTWKHKLSFICRTVEGESEEGVLDHKGPSLYSSSLLSKGDTFQDPRWMPKPWIVPSPNIGIFLYVSTFSLKESTCGSSELPASLSSGRLLGKIRVA